MSANNRFYVDIMSMHNEVTGSCNLVIVKFPNRETIRFIVDCGLFQETKYANLNNELDFNPENLDFCLVTHNHVDHVGRLPFVVKNGFCGPIYLTNVSSKLLPLTLEDSCKVLGDVGKRQNKSALYNAENVEETLDLLRPIEFNKTTEVKDNVKVTFFKNGHLIGAALILVQISYPGYEDINLLFTGDYNDKNVFFDVDILPEWVLKLRLTIIQESTYGLMTTDEMQSNFVNNIQKCIANNGEVVSLVFSLGRAQEILYELKRMQEKGQLDVNVPIYFDGKLARKYTKLYLKEDLGIKPEMKEFLPKNLTLVDDHIRCNLIENTSSKIIVTTSGMGTYGPAPIYLLEYVKRENALIQFTGYTAEGTLGDSLKRTKKGEKVQVRGALVKKLANVQSTNEFSAHAKSDQMIKFLNQFENLRLVLINHGEETVKEQFAKKVLDEVNTKYVGILSRSYLFRVNPYGLVKTMSTKFE